MCESRRRAIIHRRRGRTYTRVIHDSVPRNLRAAAAAGRTRRPCVARRGAAKRRSHAFRRPRPTLAPPPLILASRSAGRAALLRQARRAGRDRPRGGRRGGGQGRDAGRGGAAARHRRCAGRAQGAAGGGARARTGWCSAPTRCWSAAAASSTSRATSAEARAQLAALRGQRHELLSAAVVFESGRAGLAPHRPRAADHAAVQRRLPRRLPRRAGDASSSPPSAPTASRTAARSSSARVEGDIFTIMGLPLLELLGLPPHPRDLPRMTGAPLLAGVIGWPIAHSRSPRLHGHWLRRYGIDGYYIPIGLPPEGFAAGLRAAHGAGLSRRQRHHPAQGGRPGARHRGEPARGGDRRGQHPHLPAATARIHADNTDGYGFIANLRQQAPRLAGRGRAGAGARRRRQRPRRHRRADRRGRARRCGSPAAPAPAPRRCSAHFGPRLVVARLGGRAPDAAADAATIVNATPLGMAGGADLPLRLERRSRDGAGHRPRLRRRAHRPSSPRRARLGLTAVDGLGMLLHQARARLRALVRGAPGGRRRAARRGAGGMSAGPTGSA